MQTCLLAQLNGTRLAGQALSRALQTVDVSQWNQRLPALRYTGQIGLVLLLLTLVDLRTLTHANSLASPPKQAAQKPNLADKRSPSPLAQLTWLQAGMTHIESSDQSFKWFQRGIANLSQDQQTTFLNLTQNHVVPTPSEHDSPDELHPELAKIRKQTEWLLWLQEGMAQVENPDRFLDWLYQGTRFFSPAQQSDLVNQLRHATDSQSSKVTLNQTAPAIPKVSAPDTQATADLPPIPAVVTRPNQLEHEGDLHRVIALLREFFPNGGDFGVRVWTDKGKNAWFEAGEPLLVYIESAIDAYLQVDYYQADGQVVHLLPNLLDSNRITADQIMTLGSPSSSFKFSVAAPFGAEMLTVIAGQRPLMGSGLAPPIEPAEAHIQRQINQFESYKAHGQTAAAYLRIHTRDALSPHRAGE